MTIRVVLAEDSYLIREGVALMLEAEPGLELVASCADLPTLLRHVDADPPDVVVTDIRMPPTHTDEGIQAAEALRDSHAQVGVVVLSQYVEPGYATRLLAAGSARRAYLLKERVGDVGELVAAIRAVAEGGSTIDPKVVDALVEGQRRRSSVLDELTPREVEVLSHMARGANNSAIAEALVLTSRAVEKHINSIFAKLGMREEPDSHHRVRAVLLFLAEQTG